MDLLNALRTHLGHDSFRPGQENVICALPAGESAPALFPTGAGKSLCRQIPAVLRDWTGRSSTRFLRLKTRPDKVGAIFNAEGTEVI
jgi:superfamily II DNA helicase RecQ